MARTSGTPNKTSAAGGVTKAKKRETTPVAPVRRGGKGKGKVKSGAPKNNHIQKPVIKRLATHAGIWRLQYAGNVESNDLRKKKSLISAGERDAKTNSTMIPYIRNQVDTLLDDVLLRAGQSALYAGRKTVMVKDVVEAYKSKGYQFNYDESMNAVLGHKSKGCRVPKREKKSQKA